MKVPFYEMKGLEIIQTKKALVDPSYTTTISSKVVDRDELVKS